MKNVYMFKNCRAKAANIKFGCCNKNQMELMATEALESEMEKSECLESDASFTSVRDIHAKCATNLIIGKKLL